MGTLKKIIMVTSAPANSGLAYFHYLALRDITNLPIQILDNGEQSYNRAFVKRILNRIHRELGMESCNQLGRIIKALNGKPETIAVVMYNLGCLRHKEILSLQKTGAALYGLFPDSPFGMQPEAWNRIRIVLPLFKCVFTFLNNLVPVYYQYGAKRVQRIPFAYCRYTHMQNDSSLHGFDGHVYYFGTYGPLIENWLQPLLKFNLVICGHDWENSSILGLRKAVKYPIPHDKEMTKIVGGQLVVNFIRAQHGSGHSMKTFELPAAGACVITNRSEEQLEFFPENSCVSYFDTPAEMLGLVRGFMENPEKIPEMVSRRNSYLANNSYHERVTWILRELEESISSE